MKLRYQILAIAVALLLSGCAYSGGDPTQTTLSADTGTETTVLYIENTEPETTSSSPENTETGPETTAPPTEVTQPEPDDADFVRITDYIPDILVELPYASDSNFTHQKIYDFSDPWLRYGTVKKLMQVQEDLKQMGLSLKIWDAFRPTAAQQKLWDIYPDPTYVSDPSKGFTSHCRGNTVDITLVYADGREVVMPTGFDDFSTLADRDYSDCSEEAAANAILLETLMKEHGFKAYHGEWWHYTDVQDYPVEKEFLPVDPVWYYADCKEYISLRTKPDTAAQTITRITAKEEFQVVAVCGDFALVDYGHLQGFVLRSHIRPAP